MSLVRLLPLLFIFHFLEGGFHFCFYFILTFSPRVGFRPPHLFRFFAFVGFYALLFFFRSSFSSVGGIFPSRCFPRSWGLSAYHFFSRSSAGVSFRMSAVGVPRYARRGRARRAGTDDGFVPCYFRECGAAVNAQCRTAR